MGSSVLSSVGSLWPALSAEPSGQTRAALICSAHTCFSALAGAGLRGGCSVLAPPRGSLLKTLALQRGEGRCRAGGRMLAQASGFGQLCGLIPEREAEPSLPLPGTWPACWQSSFLIYCRLQAKDQHHQCP